MRARHIIFSAALAICIAAVGSVGFLVVREARSGTPVAAGPFMPAPWFEFVNHDGERRTLDDYAGQAVLLNFIFTRCPDVCHIMTAEMNRVQRALQEKGLFGDKVRFVSITMDPEYDTPEVLKDYGERMGADLSGWDFLSGSVTETARVVAGGFGVYFAKVPLAESAHAHHIEARGDDDYTIEHTVATYVIGPDGMLWDVYTDVELDVRRTVRDLENTLGILPWWRRWLPV